MDFGTLLHKAQRNEGSRKEPIRYYSTKYEPPKKEQRNKAQLSVNIKRFLERKEQEEKQKMLEARKKKEELIALRSKDKKAVKRVSVMLKRTKSANQSVIQDAVDTDNTAVTLAGPAQPDEDDYGYVSQEASAYYNKMMEKYSKLPTEPPKFSLEKKKISTNLSSTKDRVRAALEKEKEEAMLPHKRKRKHKTEGEEGDRKEPDDRVEEPDVKKVKTEKIKPKAPPPMNFADLLKLAEKKQFEPIIIEKKPKEEESLLTKKQKREMERMKEWQDKKNERNKQANPNAQPSMDKDKKSRPDAPSKLEEALKKDKKPVAPKDKKQPEPEVRPKIDWGPKHPGAGKMNSANSSKTPILPQRSKPEPPKPTRDVQISKQPKPSHNEQKLAKPQVNTKLKEPPRELTKPKKFPPPDLQPKRFPPPDIRRKPNGPSKLKLNRGRIMDDDDDEDSEMDDFIDDGPEEEEDYSKYISEIFGYNKSKYVDYDDDDIMESSFAQQMREEVQSTKIGIKEDLEDMKMEEEHKRRKALLKKKMANRK